MERAHRLYGSDPAVTSSLINSVSCARDGRDGCAAGGWFTHSDGTQHAFVVSEAKGNVGTPLEVPGTPLATGGSAAVFAVSCAAATACAAGGHTVTSGDEEPFVVDETSSGWGTARPLQNMDQLNKSKRGLVLEISCGAPGDCVATGTYQDAHAVSHAFEAEETSGTWGPAQPLPGMDQLTSGQSAPTSVSCSGSGDCAIGGSYSSSDGAHVQAFVIDEHGGAWGSAQQVPGSAARNTSGFATVASVSCAAAGECAAVGFYTTPGGRHQFVTRERAGTWQPSVHDLTLTGAARGGLALAAHAISCASSGNCAVVGEYSPAQHSDVRLFTANQVAGTWGKAHELPGDTKLNTGKFGGLGTISCAAAGNCATGGFYTDGQGHDQGLVANESAATTTRLSLSAARIRRGHEQSERISVRVTGHTGGTPGGTVAVKAGTRTVCTIKLAGAKGGCKLGARTLKPGQYQLTAVYGGSQVYAGSRSGARTLTVTR